MAPLVVTLAFLMAVSMVGDTVAVACITPNPATSPLLLTVLASASDIEVEVSFTSPVRLFTVAVFEPSPM